MSTDIEGVILNFNTKNQRLLSTMTPEEAADYRKEGHFSTGSMLPKVEAALQFTTHDRRQAVITSIQTIEAAVKGKAGTEFLAKA